jgi:ADP-heptose:LPS heptosyltransferase
MVELCPYIDRCVSVDGLTWWGRIKSLKIPLLHRFERFVRNLNRLWNIFFSPFDVIIYPVKSPQIPHLQIVYELLAKKNVGIIGCAINAPHEGYPSDLRPENLFTEYFDASSLDPWQHELITTLEFLRFLRCKLATTDEIHPEFWLSDADKYKMSEISAGKKIIGIFPGASSKERCWLPKNYAAVARLIDNLPVYVILGGPADMALASEVESSLTSGVSSVKVINLAGKTSLRELTCMISACTVLIGMETSGLHIAIAAGIPAVGIVGGGHYGRFIPWGNPDKHIMLTHKAACFNCKWLCNKNSIECIQMVAPEEVSAAVNSLLKGS